MIRAREERGGRELLFVVVFFGANVGRAQAFKERRNERIIQELLIWRGKNKKTEDEAMQVQW